jgi:hypothetical protein
MLLLDVVLLLELSFFGGFQCVLLRGFVSTKRLAGARKQAAASAGCCTCSYYAKERTFATLHVVQQSLTLTVLGFSNWGSTSSTAGLAL